MNEREIEERLRRIDEKLGAVEALVLEELILIELLLPKYRPTTELTVRSD